MVPLVPPVVGDLVAPVRLHQREEHRTELDGLGPRSDAVLSGGTVCLGLPGHRAPLVVGSSDRSGPGSGCSDLFSAGLSTLPIGVRGRTSKTNRRSGAL